MNKASKHLIIRADATHAMGTGHLMRCLALAQSWREIHEGRVTFITLCKSLGLLRRIVDAGFEVKTLKASYPDKGDLDSTLASLNAKPQDTWLVLDGYHFDSDYQRRIKEAGHLLLAIDDLNHLGHYYSDIVVNQNIYARSLEYSCEPYTQLLLGTEYALLRQEFISQDSIQREIAPVARKILVSLGGSDPCNQTMKVLRALQSLDMPGLEAKIVIGSSNRRLDEIREIAEKADSSVAISIIVDAPDMAALMAWADVAVSAAGSTCWELAFMGLPALLIVLADNQTGIAGGLEKAGTAVNLGWHYELTESAITKQLALLLRDSSRRSDMSEKGRKIVDGQGCQRVSSTLTRQCTPVQMTS